MDYGRRVCVVCGGTEQQQNPLCADGFDDEELIHLRCYDSEGAAAWRERRYAKDPAYDRYCRLMAVRVPVHCPHCSASLDMSPKAVGMGAGSWPVNCTACHRTSPRNFSGYGAGEDGYLRLESIRGDFVRSRDLEHIDQRVRKVARDFDRLIEYGRCTCGAPFSLAAKPRCPHCDHVVFDTYFHVIDEPLSEEQRKRLDALFRND